MKQFLKISLLLLAFLSTACQNQHQMMRDQSTAPAFQKGKQIMANFTGTAWLEMLAGNDTTFNTSVSSVSFEPKARTNWHKHPGGQILLVTDGQGYYQEKGKPAQVLHKGDVVKIAPNTVHWHGASADKGLVHIAIGTRTDKGNVVWLQPVSEEEYNLVQQTK